MYCTTHTPLHALLLASLTVVLGCDSSTPVYPVSDKRPSNATCLAQTAPPPPGRIRLERAFNHALTDGDKLRELTALVQSPADDSEWFVTAQSGQIYRFSANSTEPGMSLVLDVRAQTDFSSGENGLVSLALDPDFGANGHCYVVYTVPPSGTGAYVSRVARFTLDGTGVFDLASEKVILDIPQFANTHSGNHVAFGNDGMLYYSLGEDKRPEVHPQDPTSLQGKVLRIDVSREEGGNPYAIPADNPFVAGGGAPEVYAYGLRNPWRFTIDPDTSELFLGDVGRDRREEINRIEPAGNYGWPAREGTLCHLSDPCEDPEYIDPVVEFSHSEGKAVVAGYRYRGEIPELVGRYVYGDFVTGNLWSIDPDEPAPASELELEGAFSLSSFAQSRDGELYVVRYVRESNDGGVYRIAPNDPGEHDFPVLLSDTGCFAAGDPAQVVSGVVPFEPVAPLWSDGSEKQRFFAIPDNRRIAIASDGDMVFPPGSVLIKHFRYNDKLHETRLLMRDDDQWTGYSYEWNNDQTEAYLLDTARTLLLDGDVRWTYPSRSQCMLCHTDTARQVLGLEVSQLDHPFSMDVDGQEPVNQLEWLLAHDYFEPDIGDADALRARMNPLVSPEGTGPLQNRVRSYLHSNCSMCHRPGGDAQGDADMRINTDFSDMKLCDELPQIGSLWGFGPGDDQRLIRPGSTYESILYLRMSLVGFFRMPPLGSEEVDSAGLDAVGEWILGLEECPQ